MSKGKDIVCTGGAGFIGSRVVKQLLDDGYTEFAAVRPTTNTRRLEGLNCRKMGWQISPKRCFPGAKRMVGTYGCGTPRKPFRTGKTFILPKCLLVVIEGSKNVIQAAEKNGNLRMVCSSSSTTAIDGTGDHSRDPE